MFNKLSLAEQVEDALRKEITEGRVRPGQRVSMADYQQSWNVSSTPFRDAVRALENQGFLTVSPRKGVFVSPMNLRAFQEIFEVRIALECVAVELATPLVPQDRADAALEIYQQMRPLLSQADNESIQTNDRLVHDLAREHCGNRRLQRLLVEQMDLIRWAQNTIILEMPESYELALPEHIAIVEAMCARDPAAASQAMRTHLQNARTRHESWLKSHLEKQK
jgi:DNA-binding GntR family transcriptional regulator